MSASDISPIRLNPKATLWEYLALPDADLERADIVAMNLSAAKGIASLRDMDVARYTGIVDGWTRQFAQWLPGAEARFRQTPERWKNDIRFFRVGMLQGFLGDTIGTSYIEEQKKGTVRYTNPGDLFLHGLIDTKRGTCANMPTLHAAIARRMGWPVTLACAKSHQFSRFDDGQVIYNIEATSTHPGQFCAEDDAFYMKEFNLPKRAVECGSDLRKLTAREMMAIFIAFRGRHHVDIGRRDLADSDFSLARALFPNHRNTHIRAMIPYIRRGERLFHSDEVGHPRILAEDLNGVGLNSVFFWGSGPGCKEVEYVFRPAPPPVVAKAPVSQIITVPVVRSHQQERTSL